MDPAFTSRTDVTTALAPAASWRDAAEGEHFAQFFESDAVLIDAVCAFGAEGLASREAVVLIATSMHLAAIERRWLDRRIDVAAAKRSGQYVPVEAHALLEQLSMDDWPSAAHFREHVETLIASVSRGATRLRAFGEMVGLLWSEGRYAAAIRLEELWNELAQRYDFTLFCGYPMSSQIAAPDDALRRVCSAHARAIPAESYVDLSSPTDRLAEICDLQNKARCYERELHERKAAERRLARREQELDSKVRELAELDRRKDEYLAMLGHELRNPLAAIRNAAAALSREAAGAARQTLCEVIGRQAAQMGRLLDDLLDVSRITQGKILLRRETCELASILARAIEISRPLIDERCQRLETRLPPEAIRFDGDSMRLVQAIGNLLHNAAKYTAPGGEITLIAGVDGDGLNISVADNGIGIAAEMLPRIFEPFVQAEQALERAQGGLGLGLTLVRGIAALHGGTVEAVSAGPGCGTQMTIRLPIFKTARPGARPNAQEPSAAGRRKRVLIVDDNRDAAESLALLLGLCGHEVQMLSDGNAAVEAAHDPAPDLIILDIGLPRLDGYEAARRLRARGCTARLAAVTGYGRPEDRRRARECGFDDFFVKPLDPRELERLLSEPRRPVTSRVAS